MGWFSKITKGIKNIFKGVGKLFKSVGKALKGVLQSKLGKLLLIAAAIWLGGAAIGLWNSGFASIDGALVASETVSTTAGATAAGEAATTGAATEAAAAAATGAAPTAGTAVTAAAPGAVPGVGAGAPAIGTPFTMAAPAAAPAVVAGGGEVVGGTGFITAAGKAASGAAKWMAANPIPTLLGGQMLASAFSPNALDVAGAENQYRLEEEQRRQEEINAANARIAEVGGIPTWSWSGKALPPVTSPQVQIPTAGIMGSKVSM